MDRKLVKKMDSALIGPRLLCESCCKKKVLSPCYFCQYSKGNKLNKTCCRGCGRNYCLGKREVCKVLAREKLLQKIYKIAIKGEVKANFSYCGMRELPAEIGQLVNLQDLLLEGNMLRELPAEIGQLINLKRLYLGDNQLKRLPAEIGQLTNLYGMDLYNNELREFPAEVGQLVNLEIMNLGKNPISQCKKQELRKTLPNCEVTDYPGCWL